MAVRNYAAASLLILAAARTVFAHENDLEGIPEGEGISADPIVSLEEIG
jgi:hypothetical protein